MKQSRPKKLLSIIAALSLLLNQFLPIVSVLVDQAYAQEEATDSAELVIKPSPSPEISPSPSFEPSPTISPSPEVIIPSPEPSVESSPEVQTEPESTETTEPPKETSPPPSPEVEGQLSVIVLPPTFSVPEIDLDPADIFSAQLFTDKPDYAPTETVIISGKDFTPNKTYTLIISSEDEPAVIHEDFITTDDQGTFIYSYQLDGNYRPNYKVEVKAENSVIASTTFTDTDPDPAPVINYVSFNPSSGTLGIGQTIKVTFKVGTTPGLSGTATVNGHAYTLSSVFGGQYDAFYVIQEGDSNIAEGSQIPVSVELWNQSHTAYTTNYGTHFADPGVDATRPTCSLTMAENPDQNGQYVSSENFYFNTNVISTGNFKVIATPTDSNGIQKVSFPSIVGYSGGGNEDNSDPYEGTYTWFSASQPASNNLITCYDTAGNTSTAAFNVLKDTTHPVINDVDLSDDTVKNTDVVTVTGDITETGSGIASCQAYLSLNTSMDLTGDTPLGDWGSNCQYNYTVNLADGTYYFKLKLGDKVGNFTDAKASGPMVVDSIYPTTTDDAGPGNGPAVLSSQTVTLTPNDLGGSGIADTKYCIEDSGTICTPDISGTSVIVSCPGETSCTKWIFYYSIDNSGNASSPEHSHNINIYNDLIAPSTTDDIDGAWHNTDVTVNLTCTDNTGGTGCATTYYTTNGTDPTTASATSNSLTLSSDGIHTIKYFSKDVAGNTETVVTGANQVKIDKSAPIDPGTPNASVTSPTNQASITWSWTAADTLISGIKNYLWNLWESSVNLKDSGTTTDLSKTFDLSIYGDGIFSFDVKAEDNAGNFSNVMTSVATIFDATSPTLTVTGFTADTVAMPGNLSDGYTLNSDNDPAHEFLVQFDPATDANETLASTHFGLYLTNSTVSQADLKTYYDNRGTPDPYLSYLKDAVDGAQPFAYINGSTLKLVDAARYTYQSVDTDMAVPGDYPLGTYTLSGQIQDLAGNSTTVTYKLIVAGDRVGPILQSLSSTKANGTYGPGTVINLTATYDEPLASGSTITVVLDNGVSVILNTITTNNLTGTYTVGATNSGEDSTDLTVSSISSHSVIDSTGNSASDLTLPASNLGDISNLIIDTTPPPVPSALDIQDASDSGVSNTDDITNLNPIFDVLGVADIDYYQIYWCSISSCSWSPLFSLNPGTQKTWNTSGFGADWTYRLALTSLDSLGNESALSPYLDWIIDINGPTTAEITAPQNNENIKGIYSLTANASGDYSGISKVEFWYASIGSKIGEDTTVPYSIDWDTSVVTDGSHDLWIKAFDFAGNVTNSSFITVNIDNTVPTLSANPPAGDYMTDQLVDLLGSDSGSGIDKIYYTLDGTDPDNSSTEYTASILIDHSLTLKAIAYDTVGNASSILTAVYGIAPVISGETSSSVSSTGITITWDTDDPSTSRVIYDTVSHPVLGIAPNYDYANSTVEDAVKVINHSVELTGLSSGTVYYYRTVSHGSPESVSTEKIFTTSTSSSSSTSSGDSGTGGTSVSSTVCNDQKPGSAPTLLSAVSGYNSVTLTWSKASDPVTYYLVAYGTSSGQMLYGNPNVGGAGTTSYTISNLSGGTAYYFTVRAGNNCMPGDFSNELVAVPSGGFISGPAAGFAANILGVQDQETLDEIESEATNPTGDQSQVLGEENTETSSNWWLWLLATAFGFGLIIMIRRRR